jgi:hypothetical protein
VGLGKTEAAISGLLSPLTTCGSLLTFSLLIEAKHPATPVTIDPTIDITVEQEANGRAAPHDEESQPQEQLQ